MVIMKYTTLLDEIKNRFDFLHEKYCFLLKKSDLHWLGGAVVEYEKDNLVLSILYDKRENWFYCKLFNKANLDKPPLFLHAELIKPCKLPDPVISMEEDEKLISYLDALGDCLKKSLPEIITKFETCNYWKQ